jgi:hypothetical protein
MDRDVKRVTKNHRSGVERREMRWKQGFLSTPLAAPPSLEGKLAAHRPRQIESRPRSGTGAGHTGSWCERWWFFARRGATSLWALQHTNISAARKTRALPTEFLGNTLELGRLGGWIGRGIDWERRHAGSTHDEEREDLEHFADFVSVSEPASVKMIV